MHQTSFGVNYFVNLTSALGLRMLDNLLRVRGFKVLPMFYLLVLSAAAQPAPNDSNKPSVHRQFSDPAPPRINTLLSTTPPALRPNSEVRFHSKPKPLAPDAVTHDWTSFLGPNHNAVSSETKLLTKWSESGPPLVWEMIKGKSYSS